MDLLKNTITISDPVVLDTYLKAGALTAPETQDSLI